MDEIKVRKYKLVENGVDKGVFTAYSADWCKPCQRIKPFLYNYLKDYQYEDSIMNKADFKNINKYIPFFTLNDEKIQTSDYIELKKFIKSFNIKINEEIDPNIDF